LIIGFDCELFHFIVFLWIIVGVLLLEAWKYSLFVQNFQVQTQVGKGIALLEVFCSAWKLLLKNFFACK